MNRRKFISITGATLVVSAGAYYLSTDKKNFVRTDIKENISRKHSHESRVLAPCIK